MFMEGKTMKLIEAILELRHEAGDEATIVKITTVIGKLVAYQAYDSLGNMLGVDRSLKALVAKAVLKAVAINAVLNAEIMAR